MKKNVIIVFILLVFMSVLLQADVIFSWEDPRNDDYGNGSVIYPDNPMFDERIFDILKFTMTETEADYLFEITVQGRINPVDHAEFQFSYDLPDDFILPLIHIYIDKDHRLNSGFSETIYGTNVTIEPASCWEKVVVMASMPLRYAGELERSQPEIFHNTIMVDELEITRDKRSIRANVPKRLLGEIDENWGFTVLMMSQDFSQTIRKNIYIREVNTTASQFNFGGGDSGIIKDYDPNVIDLLVPLGRKQKFILNSYDKAAKEYAKVPAVYPYTSTIQGEAVTGEVKQITDEKVVINLGSENGIVQGSRLMIDNAIVIIAEDVFPQLTIAIFTKNEQWQDVEEGMPVRILRD